MTNTVNKKDYDLLKSKYNDIVKQNNILKKNVNDTYHEYEKVSNLYEKVLVAHDDLKILYNNSKNSQETLLELMDAVEEMHGFGHYKCKKCKNKWSSGHSYPNYFQKCEKCYNNVYPHKIENYKKVDGIISEKKHPKELCQRCLSGKFCDIAQRQK